MAVDPESQSELAQADGDAALSALAEWSAARAPQARQRLRHQAQQLRDAMAAAGELSPHAALPAAGDNLSADG
jgi:hypothetical protein